MQRQRENNSLSFVDPKEVHTHTHTHTQPIISTLKKQKNWKTFLQNHELALFYVKETDYEF